MLWMRPGRWQSLAPGAEALCDQLGVSECHEMGWTEDDLALACLKAEDLWPDALAAQLAAFEEIRAARFATKDVKSKPQASSPAPA